MYTLFDQGVINNVGDVLLISSRHQCDQQFSVVGPAIYTLFCSHFTDDSSHLSDVSVHPSVRPSVLHGNSRYNISCRHRRSTCIRQKASSLVMDDVGLTVSC